MTLQPHPRYPAARCYVIKLHRDAVPAKGQLLGRLEHVASGEAVEFDSTEQLLTWLLVHAANTALQPSDDSP